MAKRRRNGSAATTGRGRPRKQPQDPGGPQDMLIARREMAAGGAPFCRVDYKRAAGQLTVTRGAMVAPLARHPMAGYPLGILRLRKLIDDSQHDSGLEFCKLYSMVFGIRREGGDPMEQAVGIVRREFLDELEFLEKYNRYNSPAAIRQRLLKRIRYTQSLVELCVNEILPSWAEPTAIPKNCGGYRIRNRMAPDMIPTGLVAIRLQLDNVRGVKRPDSEYFKRDMTT